MNELKLEFKEIIYGSNLYKQTVELRNNILRKPLGIVLTKEELAEDVTHYHLACYNEKSLIACLILTPKDGGDVQMRQVAVRGDWQGKGIGSKLVKYSEAFAFDKGYKRMILHARQSAVNFYLNLGYEIFEEPFMEVTITHRNMRKDL